MQATLERPKMLVRRGRPKTSDRDDSTVRIARNIAAKAKLIAGHRGVSVAELLSGLLETPIDRAYLQVLEEVKTLGKKPKGA